MRNTLIIFLTATLVPTAFCYWVDPYGMDSPAEDEYQRDQYGPY